MRIRKPQVKSSNPLAGSIFSYEIEARLPVLGPDVHELSRQLRAGCPLQGCTPAGTSTLLPTKGTRALVGTLASGALDRPLAWPLLT